MAAREREVAGQRRRPVQRPATGEMTQKRRRRKVGQGGEMRDGYLGTQTGTAAVAERGRNKTRGKAGVTESVKWNRGGTAQEPGGAGGGGVM